MPSFKTQDDTELDKVDELTISAIEKTEQKPRICMLTTRRFAREAFMCGFYEGQDVLIDIDNVDLIYLEPKNAYDFRKNLHEKLIWHDPLQNIAMANMSYQPINLTKEYDLLIAYLPFLEDITQLSAIRGWKSHCKKSVCWINELWVKSVRRPKFEAWLPALDQFDHIVSGLSMTAKVLVELLKRPCEFVPYGIDTLRFSPHPESPARVIEIYSMGRASPGLHEGFLDIANQKKKFYLYDTFNASEIKVKDYRQHREMLANIAKRAQYFVVSPARRPVPNASIDQIEVSARYFEAAAAGAILLGETPNCAAFNELFNWTDAVIDVQTDGSNVADILASLAAKPERLKEISHRNAREALLRHDWVYRWRKILQISGLPVSPKLELRENTLAALALNIHAENH